MTIKQVIIGLVLFVTVVTIGCKIAERGCEETRQQLISEGLLNPDGSRR